MKNFNLTAGFGPLLIVIGIAVVALVVGGTYYASKKSPEAEQEETKADTRVDSATQADVSVEAEAQSGTLRELLSMKQDITCTFNSDVGGDTSGVVYISDGKMRGDFVSQSSVNAQVESHMILQDSMAYVWSGSQGAKMDISKLQADTSGQAGGSVDLDAKVDYTCEDWKKDETKFTLPGTVTFIDIGAMMQGALQGQLQF